MFLPSKKEQSDARKKAVAGYAKLGDRAKSTVQGSEFTGESLTSTRAPGASREARKFTPIVKPNAASASSTAGELRENIGAADSAATKPPSKSKPSTAAELLLTPEGAFAKTGAGSADIVSPKSDVWNAKIDIRAMRTEAIVPPKVGTDGVPSPHRKPKYGGRQLFSGDLNSHRSSSQSDAEEIAFLERIMAASTSGEALVYDEGFQVEGLEPRLLPHQQKGIQFMINREKEDSSSVIGSDATNKISVLGGLLCDDMGLGKTVQSLGLILSNRPPKDFPGLKATLVVAPLSVATQWHEEIRQKAPILKSVIFHGEKKKRLEIATRFSEYDVVITTYNLVSRAEEDSPLLESKWYRIIADEAHEFRTKNTAISKAMLKLDRNARHWALTGTPVHNTARDLLNLLQFVGLPIQEKVLRNFNYSSTEGTRAREFIRTALHAVMLRRRQDILNKELPPLRRERVAIAASPKQLQLMKEGTLADGGNRLVLIGRLRQICDDPAILPQSALKSDGIDGVAPLKEVTSENTQFIIEQAAESDDSFHTADEDGAIDDLVMSLASVKIGEPTPEGIDHTHWSPKTREIVKTVQREPGHKFVIFSSYKTMLGQLARALVAKGVGFRYFVGSMSIEERTSALAALKNQKDVQVLLCTLQTASVGLNIAFASRVIMVEPWWNPMIVDQAIKRVHRLGQNQPVLVYEMMLTDTIEERIFEIREIKEKLAEDLLRKPTKLTEEEKEYLISGRRTSNRAPAYAV